MLANTMREKDPNGTDHIPSIVVENCVKAVGIKLDKMVMQKWIKTADPTGKGFCTISRLIEIMRKATNPLNDVVVIGGQ